MRPDCRHDSASAPHFAAMRDGGFLYCNVCKQYVPGPDVPELCPAVSVNLGVSACVCFKGHTGGHVFARAIRGEHGACAGVVFHEDGPVMSKLGKQIGKLRFDEGARPPRRAEASALWAYLAGNWQRKRGGGEGGEEVAGAHDPSASVGGASKPEQPLRERTLLARG